MAQHTLTLEQLKGPRLEEVLHEVAEKQEPVTVLLPDGREVVIAPKPQLKPLPQLVGRVPPDWKDAIYARS